MNIFDLIIVQPIFNVLTFLYGILPGSDFGVAIILFTIIIRIVMWPLVKKQLYHTKVMRQIQPELAKIKAKAKGNRQLESQLMMELYREKGVNPFGSFGLLLLQLPVFIALYQVIHLITIDRANIGHFTYDFLQHLPRLSDVIAHPDHFNESLFGVVNLAKTAVDHGTICWPILLLAVMAAILQYIQSKQLAPAPSSNRKLRDVLKDQAAGKKVDQSEVTTLITNQTLFLFPLLTLIIALYLPGALVLYYVASSLVAVIQQYVILSRDETELEVIAEESPRQKSHPRATTARPAEIVSQPTEHTHTKKKKRRK